MSDEMQAYFWWREFADAWRLLALAELQWRELYVPFMHKGAPS